MQQQQLGPSQVLMSGRVGHSRAILPMQYNRSLFFLYKAAQQTQQFAGICDNLWMIERNANKRWAKMFAVERCRSFVATDHLPLSWIIDGNLEEREVRPLARDYDSAVWFFRHHFELNR